MNENKTNEDYELNAKRPTYEGIISLEFDKNYPIINLIDTDLVNSEGIYVLKKPKNRGRAAEVSSSVIKQWEKLHTEGKYDDFHHEAPMINVDELLGDSIVTGYSKDKGKISSLLKKIRKDGTYGLITDKDTIGVWKVKFGTYKGKSANYWMGVAQSNENMALDDNPDFIKNDRTVEDVAGSIYDLFQSNDFEMTDSKGAFCEDGLHDTMKDFKLDSKTILYKKVKEQFYELIGVKDQSLPFSGSQTNKCTNSEGITTTIGQEEEESLKKYLDNNPDVVVVEHNVLDRGEGGTAHALITKVLEKINEHEEKDHIKLDVILKISNVSSKKQLENAKPHWRDWFINPNKMFMQQHKLWKSNVDLDKITFRVKFRYSNPEEQKSFWNGKTKYEFGT